MTAEQMLRQVKAELSRPDTDIRFADSDIWEQLREAERTIKNELAKREQTRRVVLEHPCVVPPDDDTGTTYTIPDLSVQTEEAGVETEVARYVRLPIYFRVWTPPGIGSGREIFPADRSLTHAREGYLLRQNVIHMTTPRVYTPGLYVEGTFDFGIIQGPDEQDADAPFVDSGLTPALHPAQVLYAAAEIADRPFTGMDAESIRSKAERKLAQIVSAQTFTVERPDLEHDTAFSPWWRSADLGGPGG